MWCAEAGGKPFDAGRLAAGADNNARAFVRCTERGRETRLLDAYDVEPMKYGLCDKSPDLKITTNLSFAVINAG